jgi:serine/threonine protein kinase/tetratricopeptide (TPR) repeat protein
MPLAPGTRLGPYLLQSLLGSGGMGEVYRAEDSRLRRTVAIKVLRPDLATPDRLARFEQEARAVSSLNHPNILTIHDVGREGETAYFATEWVDGLTIRLILKQGPVPMRRAIKLAHQVAEGLAKAHAAGIVHRDLKPENVMVTGDGLAKILDFGIAKLAPGTPFSANVAERETQTITQAATAFGSVLGTVGYMSPEQASGRTVDHRSDQFALGLLIYELVTRTRPFERATTAQSLAATIDEDPAPIETLKPDVPAHLAAVVARCLAKDPAERYESTGDLARDLKSILEAGSHHTAAAPVRSRLTSTRAAALATAVGLIAAGASTAWWWRSRSVADIVQRAERPLVVVRPFTNLSPNAAQGYFAAGMTDEIRGQLSQLSSLRLLSRNALDGYKDDVSRAVRELGIRNIVDGSVRVDADRVRVSAELVDASNQQTLWSNQYDRDFADVLTVQSDIAQQIARSLHASLSPREQSRLQQRPTTDVEAYRLALQAHPLNVFDRSQNLEAIGLLRKALKLDPNYAEAQSRIAYRLILMGYSYDDPANIDRGIAEAKAAARIDPLLPTAYHALGTGYMNQGRDAESRQAFMRVLELDPNNTSAMFNFSVAETWFGRFDSAVDWGRRGFALSGRRGNDFYHLIGPLLSIRADRQTRTLLDEAERRFPTFARVQILLSLLELFEGQVDQAVARTKGLVTRNPRNEEVRIHAADMAFLADSPDLESIIEPLMENSASTYLTVAETVRLRYAYVLTKRGETMKAAVQIAEAERFARQRIDQGNQTPALRIELAAAAMLRQDHDTALDWLTRAFEAGYREYAQLEADPILAQLRTDARYRNVLERMRRDVDAQRARAGERGLLDVTALIAPAK